MKTTQLIYIVLGIVLLVGLFFIVKPKQANNNQISTPATPIQSASPSASPKSNIKTFELVIVKKELTSGADIIKVEEGDEVTIYITSDEPEELHVHGYDKSVELMPNQKSQLSFTADKTGRFIFELEKSGTDLGAIEVSPK